MRYLTTLIFSILWVLSSHAQEFGTHWISYPLPSDSAEVLFRQRYLLEGRPLQASLSIASTGSYRLYVNERNVTRSVKFDGIKDSTLLNRTIDITKYLRSGENVIAVWYSPEGKPSHGKQLSLEFYGWNQDTTSFYHQTDGKWYCRQLRDCSHGAIERFDGRTNTQAWKSEEYEPYGWIHPTGSMDSAESEDKPDGQPRQEDKGYKEYKDYKVFKAENTLYNVLEPVCTFTDSLGGYNIDFGRPFHGTIRLTLRDAHRGAKLHINGYQYICNGELDEQAFFRFKFQNRRIYTITWNGRFKKSDIVNIEGLEISE